MLKKIALTFFALSVLLVANSSVVKAVPGFTTVRYIPYAVVDGASPLMDVDIPRGSGPFPCILSIHGGGWYLGNRNATDGTREVYRGYIIALIDYRLSGTWKFPAQIYDVKAAVR